MVDIQGVNHLTVIIRPSVIGGAGIQGKNSSFCCGPASAPLLRAHPENEDRASLDELRMFIAGKQSILEQMMEELKAPAAQQALQPAAGA